MSRIFASLIGALIAATPGAAEAGDFARPGPYVSVAGTIGAYMGLEDDLRDALRDLGVGGGVKLENTVGVKGRVGFRFHPRLGAELEGEYLPDAQIFVGDAGIARVRSWAVGANGRGYLLTGRFQPFALVGLGASGSEVRDDQGLGISRSATGFAARFGGGLDFLSFGWGLAYRF